MDTNGIHITGEHALKLMRAARAGRIVTADVVDEPRIVMPPKGLSAVDDFGIGELANWLGVTRDKPLHVMVPRAEARNRLSGARASVFTAQLPSNTVLELKQLEDSSNGGKPTEGQPAPLHWNPETRVFIDAPPLSLAYAATAIEGLAHGKKPEELEILLRLIALACELCGSYARDPLNPAKGECHYDDPKECGRFVTPAELVDALGRLRGVDGLERARRAAEHTIDFSGSPMETYIDLGFFLPPRYGGLSIHMPIFNQQLEVPDKVWPLLRHQSLRPDIQWSDQHLLGEYFGDKEHAGKGARVEDKNRLQDYATAQYSSVLLMYDDVRSVAALNATGERIARMLMERGVKGELYRIRRIMRSEGFHDKQNTLAKVLLPLVKRYDDDA